jgi:hypothetical protein
VLQGIFSLVFVLYSQLIILGGILMFISYLFGLMFSSAAGSTDPDATRFAIDIYLNTCLLNDDLTQQRVS